MIVRLPKQRIDTSAILKAVITRPSPSMLKRISRTKTFVSSMLEGKSIQKAKQLAGIPPKTTTRAILSTPVARLIVKELVDKNFNNKKYIKKLKQFWDARDVRVTKDGRVFETPNWDTQVKAFDRVGKMREIVAEDQEQKQPQSVTIQVVGEGNVQINENQIP